LAALRQPDAPQLALLDWVMPGRNGIEVCRAIRQEEGRPYTYLILVTGRSGKTPMLDGLEAGADDYLVKPVDTHELRARLNTAKRILDLQERLLATQYQLREQATRDSLTGLWNRPMIFETLARELTRSQREHRPLAVIMADVDHFKDVNDTHGHLVGDTVLHQTAERLLAALRPYDTVGRYGGEEFLIVLPGCCGGSALALAERLRQSVACAPLAAGATSLRVTLSLGVAAWDGASAVPDLLRNADAALYRAKRGGRNRVESDVPVAAVCGDDLGPRNPSAAKPQ
jgi:diguanylate cyclase (GGDEF)-like protein